MARYSELYLGDELTKLRDGLDVIRRVVDGEDIAQLDLYLFGIVTDKTILDAAKESLISAEEEGLNEIGDSSLVEEDIELQEIAVAIPVYSSDAIDILHGSGTTCDELSFVYQTENEGIRTKEFSKTQTKIRIDKLKEQALAKSKEDLYTYLQDKGKGSKMQISRKVERSEEATEQVPATEASATPSEPLAAGVPKQTSLKVSTIKEIVEDFLG
jgi:hypothetical protein